MTHDRREGFDRRAAYPLAGSLRQHPGLLLGVLALPNLMSAMDLSASMASLPTFARAGVAPLFAGVGLSIMGQWATRSALVLTCTTVIWMNRRRRIALLAGSAFAICYGFIVLARVISLAA